jgi:hypothetical protein
MCIHKSVLTKNSKKSVTNFFETAVKSFTTLAPGPDSSLVDPTMAFHLVQTVFGLLNNLNQKLKEKSNHLELFTAVI